MPALAERDWSSFPQLPPALGADYLRHQRIVPIEVTDDAVVVAGPEEPPGEVLDDLRVAFRRFAVEWTPATGEDVETVLDRVYADRTLDGLASGGDADALLAGAGDPASVEDLTSLANQPPVIRMVNLLLLEALDAGASDVHVECEEHGVRVRYRVDGELADRPPPPAGWRDAIVSRVKVMANLDIAERRAPQDGRIRLRLRDREIDVRVSTLPALHGESVVLRLLDPAAAGLGLDDLGMDADVRRGFERLVEKPHGILLVTGPTGSGKTTTLYAAIRRLDRDAEKIVTVEDPIEYRLPGVTQVPVNRAAGVTFANALRSILRHDPDVIMVGEMRDAETAEIAIHAALTGHLVLSTVHTNDAAGAIVRLLDLGVEDFLVASTVQGVVAQRLVRRSCARCRASASGASDCESCRGTGFRGRVGIFELMTTTEGLRAEILGRRGADSLRALACAQGMKTLRQDALAKVEAGLTTFAEVLRATEEAE